MAPVVDSSVGEVRGGTESPFFFQNIFFQDTFRFGTLNGLACIGTRIQNTLSFFPSRALAITLAPDRDPDRNN